MDYFGGIHVIATIDNFQLIIQETDNIYKHYPLLFYFEPYVLKHYIRATCPHQRNLLNLLRQHPKTPFEKEEIIQKILNTCQFKPRFELLDINHPCLTTKRKGRDKIAKLRTAAKAQEQGHILKRSTARNYAITHDGINNREERNPAILELINSKSSLTQDLTLYLTQAIQTTCIIYHRGSIIPRSTTGIITNIEMNQDDTQIAAITVDFGNQLIIDVNHSLQKSNVTKYRFLRLMKPLR